MTMLRVTLLAAAALVASVLGASAQTYPNQVVRIVVPFSAGSITDGLARILAEKLGDMWKQQVIVENRPGLPGTTGGRQGATRWLHADADVQRPYHCGRHQQEPAVRSGQGFRRRVRVAAVPLVAIVPPDFPGKTLKDFITLANEKPGQLNFSSAGVASTSYLSAEIFKQDAKINIVHVPFKGAPEATTAVIRNDVQMYFAADSGDTGVERNRQGQGGGHQLRQRVPQLPDVPTIAETLPELQIRVLVRGACAGRNAAADPDQGQRGHRESSPDAGREGEVAGARFDPGTEQAGRVRRHQQGRHRTLRQDPQGRRHHAAITSGIP